MIDDSDSADLLQRPLELPCGVILRNCLAREVTDIPPMLTGGFKRCDEAAETVAVAPWAGWDARFYTPGVTVR